MTNLVILSFTLLVLISCSKKKEIDIPGNDTNALDTTVHNNTPLDTATKTYLALGDSYTVGQSVSEEESFPVQTVKLLRKQNISVADPHIIAVTGWATADLLNSLNISPPKNNYSFVSLLIGVNNQYRYGTLDEYKSEFTELLNRAISYAGRHERRVFVLSIPDYSVTSFAHGSDTVRIAKEIDEFNEANRVISLNAGVHYLDITPISRQAKYDPFLIAGDGLHPSGLQYTKWRDLLAGMIIEEIR